MTSPDFTSQTLGDMRWLRWDKTPCSEAYPVLAQLRDRANMAICNRDNRCVLAPFGENVADNVGIDIDSNVMVFSICEYSWTVEGRVTISR